MGAKRIVELIKSYGLRINGVGFQGHLASEKTSALGSAAPAQSPFTDALRGIAADGVYVAYTEVDACGPGWDVSAECGIVHCCAKMRQFDRLGKQDQHFVVFKDGTDKYSWNPSTFAGEGAALLWDDSYVKKAVYNGFLTGLQQ
ncbi:unnamed protein product [Alternaria alternata]